MKKLSKLKNFIKITVIGSEYVGLVSSACLFDFGTTVKVCDPVAMIEAKH